MSDLGRLCVLSTTVFIVSCSGDDGGTVLGELPACEQDTDCDGGEFCRDGRCREACGGGDSCTGLLAMCDETRGLCVECKEASDCDGRTCDTDRGVCAAAECSADSDCDGGEQCSGGACVVIRPDCDEEVDLDTDPNNCGECGNVCSESHASATCEDGRCIVECEEGWADCNGDAEDGCEGDLSSSATCGDCSTTCSGSESCIGTGGDSYACGGDTCGNGEKDGDEEGVDCGGSCAPCDAGVDAGMADAGMSSEDAGTDAAVVCGAAPALDCACDGAYRAGDRVHAVVDNPEDAPGLMRGHSGTIVAGQNPGSFELLVEWDDWNEGHDGNCSFADCGSCVDFGTNRWWVRCGQVACGP